MPVLGSIARFVCKHCNDRKAWGEMFNFACCVECAGERYTTARSEASASLVQAFNAVRTGTDDIDQGA